MTREGRNLLAAGTLLGLLALVVCFFSIPTLLHQDPVAAMGAIGWLIGVGFFVFVAWVVVDELAGWRRDRSGR